MAKCNYCSKGSQVGNAVSHAKNRTKRLFKPNLHQLRVKLHNMAVKVVFCAKCIKRLRRDGILGRFTQIKYTSLEKKTEKPKNIPIVKKEKKEAIAENKETVDKSKKIEKQESVKPAMSIEDIVGKKA